MKRLNISRKDLGEKIGVSLSSVAAYLAGHNKIRKTTALAIQACYGVNADWLLHSKRPIFSFDTKERLVGLSDNCIELAITCSNLQKKHQRVLKEITNYIYIADKYN